MSTAISNSSNIWSDEQKQQYKIYNPGMIQFLRSTPPPNWHRKKRGGRGKAQFTRNECALHVNRKSCDNGLTNFITLIRNVHREREKEKESQQAVLMLGSLACVISKGTPYLSGFFWGGGWGFSRDNHEMYESAKICHDGGKKNGQKNRKIPKLQGEKNA